MTLEFLEKLTFAPAKKHAFRRRTAQGKFPNLRRKIFAEYLERVLNPQSEKAEISAVGVRPLGLLVSQEEVCVEESDSLPERAQVAAPQDRPSEVCS